MANESGTLLLTLHSALPLPNQIGGEIRSAIHRARKGELTWCFSALAARGMSNPSGSRYEVRRGLSL